MNEKFIQANREEDSEPGEMEISAMESAISIEPVPGLEMIHMTYGRMFEDLKAEGILKDGVTVIDLKRAWKKIQSGEELAKDENIYRN
jgi:uncharacterized protein YukJ